MSPKWAHNTFVPLIDLHSFQVWAIMLLSCLLSSFSIIKFATLSIRFSGNFWFVWSSFHHFSLRCCFYVCYIYVFMLFPSLKFLYGFFCYHLGIGLQSLEAGRFFQWDWVWAHYLCIGNPLWFQWLLHLFSNVHSDMVLLTVHSRVAWLQAEQTVSSLHHWCLLCSIKDFCFQLSPLLMALAGKRWHEYSLVWCILSLFCLCPVCCRTAQFPNLLHFPTSEVMAFYLCGSTASCQQKIVRGR